jgi:hypothetical protein
MQAWVTRFNELSPEAQKMELLRCRRDFYRPCTSSLLRLTPDLGRVPEAVDLDAETADAETASKVRELVQFIRKRFGKRCAVAAQAIMDGCCTGAEVGARMGIARQSADWHLAKIRSKPVQRKAIQLGLVTRESFLKALKEAHAKTSTRRTRAKRKVTKRVLSKRTPKRAPKRARRPAKKVVRRKARSRTTARRTPRRRVA